MTASVGAFGECTVMGNYAIHGARHRDVLAGLNLVFVGAGFASDGGLSPDVTPALALAGATTQRTGSPVVPNGHLAIDRARK